MQVGISMGLPRSQVNIQRPLLPQNVYHALLIPILTVIGKPHVKVPHDPSQDESHLGVGEAIMRGIQSAEITARPMLD